MPAPLFTRQSEVFVSRLPTQRAAHWTHMCNNGVHDGRRRGEVKSQLGMHGERRNIYRCFHTGHTEEERKTTSEHTWRGFLSKYYPWECQSVTVGFISHPITKHYSLHTQTTTKASNTNMTQSSELQSEVKLSERCSQTSHFINSIVASCLGREERNQSAGACQLRSICSTLI